MKFSLFKKSASVFFLLFLISCVQAPEAIRVNDWQFFISDSINIPEEKDTRWQPYQLNTSFNSEIWLKASIPADKSHRFLFLPHSALRGYAIVYYRNDILYETDHKPKESEFELAEAIMDSVMPHLLPIGKLSEPVLFIKLKPIPGYSVSLTKSLELINEGDYLKLLIRGNIDIFFVASVLIFIALISLPGTFLFPAERNRILILAGLNLIGAITVSAGTPYVWIAFSHSFASVRWVMMTQCFIPVFVFWFFYTDTKKHKRLVGFLFYLHLFAAVVSVPVIITTGMFGNTVADLNLALFFITQIPLIYVIFTDYFQRDRRSRIIAYGSLLMMFFSVNDLLKSFGIILLTERPTFHWGLLMVSLVMLYIVYLEFFERGELIKKNLEHFKELAFITSHKLRHPISNMIGLVQMLEDQPLKDTEKTKWVEMVSLTTKQLDAMVHKMNELTVIEAYKKENRDNEGRVIKEVILIDDDRINNLVNERFIAFHAPHIKIVVFDKAEKALEYIETHENLIETVIYLDINMDGMNGFQFLDAARHLENQLMVNMLSSSIDDDDIQRAYQYHCVYEYVIKPLRQKDVAAFV